MKKFSDQIPFFCNFKNGPKSIFELGNSLKQPKIAISRKKILIYLISRLFKIFWPLCEFGCTIFTWSPSVAARILMICAISSWEYGRVLMMSNRSKRSLGIPWGEMTSVVPLTVHFPRLVAKMTKKDKRSK